MNKPFGYSYLLDCYGAKDLDNMEKMYRFLEKLVDKLDMTLAGAISVIHGPVAFEAGMPKELYEDKAGLTAFCPLITSAIVCHTIVPREFLTIDVYSCKEYDPATVRDFTQETFNFDHYEEVFLERGLKY